MKQVSEMSQGEVGAYVQSHLRQKSIDVVLSGGAAVAIYTSGKYVTHGIDLVNRYSAKRASIKAAMEELGFADQGRYFKHPNTGYFVEFPPGPLSIGDELDVKIEELHLETGILRVVSPTDSIKDRLAWFYHYGDAQCLSQAVLIAHDHPIDLRNIEEWSKSEGKAREFKIFRKQLRG